MTTQEFYDYIMQHMTPEQAVMKFIEGGLIKYEKLKFETLVDKDGEMAKDFVHPLFIIAMAAMDMGWEFAVENGEQDAVMRGLVVGTPEYMDTIFPSRKK